MEMSASDFIVTKLRERDPNIDEADIRARLRDLNKEDLLKLVSAVYQTCVLGDTILTTK